MKKISTGLIPLYGIWYFFKNRKNFDGWEPMVHGFFCGVSNVWFPAIVYFLINR